jgi:hypothetical protein
MRVRAHGMQQATDYTGPVTVLVTALVTVLVIMTELVIVVWATLAVHIIQHARENALPHINTYQGRALAK